MLSILFDSLGMKVRVRIVWCPCTACKTKVPHVICVPLLLKGERMHVDRVSSWYSLQKCHPSWIITVAKS